MPCSTAILVIVLLLFKQAVWAQEPATVPLSVKAGRIYYQPDSLGNRIPDFSWCGYESGAKPIPDMEIRVVVPFKEGDATDRIQAAIDYVSKLVPGKDGFRGAVLLLPGTHEVFGSIRLHTSGVVLRGSGQGKDGTLLMGMGKTRETLIEIAGKNDPQYSAPVKIVDDYVPVNANLVFVDDASGFRVGDLIRINRPCTKEWIDALGTDHFGGGITSLGWKPGQREINWTRTITGIEGNQIKFDAPITTALDKKYGGGTLSRINWPGLINQCGVENLLLQSSFDPRNEKDEDHRWMAIVIDRASDAWVRQVSFKHFAGSAVAILDHASRVTVEDCISTHPVSETGGERRNTFFTSGQQSLFQRCYAEFGMHDFTTGFCAPGPNAFVQCESRLPLGFSGGLDSWASGVLFDVVNIDGQAISLLNRGQDGQGAGWNMANSVLWNCSASRIDCFQPPTAQNWAFGSWSQFSGNGYWAESNNHLQPRSLYYAQLRERIGDDVDKRIQVMETGTEASSSPSVETANELSWRSLVRAATLPEFIEAISARQPINIAFTGIKTIDEIGLPKTFKSAAAPSLTLKNGWLTKGDILVSGGRTGVPWWSGSARPYALQKSGWAITRFVPGRKGKGLTDDLDEMTDSLKKKNIVLVDHNYGLWYDRRRDDHERIRRMDGEVWPPFYELPFARSGQGLAWDGLSKYDLTRYNRWYWNRLKLFADLADQKGFLLIHQNYFQHNILEAGAHYADFPWRTANNINPVGFPEPVPYAGDKRIFMAAQFYDTTHPVRRDIHKKYIRQCLDNFKENEGVIQLIGEEYTGPLSFVQFWLNTIREWMQENGKRHIIGLSTTKDVQDSILADPSYADLIDVIDIKYWHYQADGNFYAPMGGQNLAPRQHARLLKPKSPSSQQVYRAVKEYKLRFPDKAVIYSADAWDRHGWAVLMAGGSLPMLSLDQDFARAIATMSPQESNDENGIWILRNESTGMIALANQQESIRMDLSNEKGSFDIHWVNMKDFSIKKTGRKKAGSETLFKKPGSGEWVLWLKKR